MKTIADTVNVLVGIAFLSLMVGILSASSGHGIEVTISFFIGMAMMEWINYKVARR